MRRFPGNVRICITAGSCFFTALLLLVLPLPWVLAAVFAAGIHEICHIAALYFCGGRVNCITLGGRGAVLETEPMSPGRELICALAGPMGGLILLLFAKWVPRVAVCAGVQSLYNLLPVYPLDGGRAIRCGAELLFPKWGGILCVLLEKCCLFGTVILAVYASFWLKLGLIPILFAVMLLLKGKNTLQSR